MSRFVRASKFRHVFGTPAKREVCFDNLKVSMNAWDTNLCSANSLFVAINWNAGGGGAFAVLPHETTGKLPENYPLFCGHIAAVLDTDFARFNDHIIASASEDTKVMIWQIPQDGPTGENITTPAVQLTGHGRKVGQVLFHPTADNVLASSSSDLTIKLWDIEKGAEKQEITGHGEVIQSMSWNWNGNLLVTTCRDKKIRVLDVRANKIVQEGNSHQGVKGSRCVWLGDADRVVTTGFSKTSDRQVYLWDSNKLSEPIKSINLDTSSGVVMPFYDNETKMLYLAGKGDGNIRFYEVENDELFYLSEYKSSEPQRGMGWLPKRACNVADCEVARMYKVANGYIEPISFTVPRKSDQFQADIFPQCPGDKPSLTADEYFEGKSGNPILIDLEKGYVSKPKEFVAQAPVIAEQEASGPKTEKEYQDAYHKLRQENLDLQNIVAQRDVKIRQLELQVEQLSPKK